MARRRRANMDKTSGAMQGRKKELPAKTDLPPGGSEGENGELAKLRELEERIARRSSQVELLDALYTLTSPRRVIWLNFLAGISRGLGITIGATIVFFVVVVILRHFVTLPVIGKFIAQILDFVDVYRNLPR